MLTPVTETKHIGYKIYLVSEENHSNEKHTRTKHLKAVTAYQYDIVHRRYVIRCTTYQNETKTCCQRLKK